MTPLRLRAIDQVDLGVISAHLQDAVLKVSDIQFEKRRRRFAILLNRFMWEDVLDDVAPGPKADTKAPYRRVRSAVHVDGVLRAQTQGLRLDASAVASLLAISFEQGNEVGGAIRFSFAGGGLIRLETECIDVWLSDLTAPWVALGRPGHEVEPGPKSG